MVGPVPWSQASRDSYYQGTTVGVGCISGVLSLLALLNYPSVFSSPVQSRACTGALASGFKCKGRRGRLGEHAGNRCMSIQDDQTRSERPRKILGLGYSTVQLWEELSHFWQGHSPTSCFVVEAKRWKILGARPSHVTHCLISKLWDCHQWTL